MKDKQIIEFMIKRATRFGRVCRAEISRVLGTSPIYVSRVTADHDALEELGLVRDGKCFAPSVSANEAAFFNDIYLASQVPLLERVRILGGAVPLWVTPGARDHIREDVIRPICRAIEQGTSLLFEYVGMGAGERMQVRRGEPIGFAFIHGRWHLRAWLYPSPTGKKEGWRDLVLGRIMGARDPATTENDDPPRGWMRRLRAAEAMADEDDGPLNTWLAEAELMPETRCLAPHPTLTPDQQSAVLQEFGLGNGGQVTLLAHEWLYMEREFISIDDSQRPPQHILVYANPTCVNTDSGNSHVQH